MAVELDELTLGELIAELEAQATEGEQKPFVIGTGSCPVPCTVTCPCD
jgi:hypothetical protein